MQHSMIALLVLHGCSTSDARQGCLPSKYLAGSMLGNCQAPRPLNTYSTLSGSSAALLGPHGQSTLEADSPFKGAAQSKAYVCLARQKWQSFCCLLNCIFYAML